MQRRRAGGTTSSGSSNGGGTMGKPDTESTAEDERRRAADARWPELALYAGWIACVVSVCFWRLARALDSVCSEPSCTQGLRTSPWGERRIDLTDTQWRDFRGNLPLLALGALVFLGCSRLVQHLAPKAPRVRLGFYAATSLVFLAYAAGAYATVLLALVLGNYALGRATGRSPATPALVWIYTFAVIIASDWYHDRITFGGVLGPAFAPLDQYHGMYGWHRGLNLVALRMISFSLDRYWALRSTPAAAPAAPADYEARVATPVLAPPDAYDLLAYIAYVFYVPLLLAGPVLPANAFLWQVYQPPAPTPARTLLWQSLRVVFALALMEWMLHYLYAYAVATSGAYRGVLDPLDIGFLGYFSLHLIWLKFLIIWRFFRIWALADNIETVENMNRCMSNNYSLQGFWRSWHRSFNRWLIRYVYVPVGGRRRRVLSTFAVFTFTAVWHDLQLNLLAWGWLIAIFIVPETVVTMYFGQPKFADLRAHWSYRHLAALGGALDILFMMIVNLVGFSVGLDGIRDYLTTAFFSSESAWFLLGTLVTFFSASQLMFAVRAAEARRNIHKDF